MAEWEFWEKAFMAALSGSASSQVGSLLHAEEYVVAAVRIANAALDMRRRGGINILSPFAPPPERA